MAAADFRNAEFEISLLKLLIPGCFISGKEFFKKVSSGKTEHIEDVKKPRGKDCR